MMPHDLYGSEPSDIHIRNECHVTQAGQFKGFEARHPAPHRASIFPKQFAEPPAAVTAGDQ